MSGPISEAFSPLNSSVHLLYGHVESQAQSSNPVGSWGVGVLPISTCAAEIPQHGPKWAAARWILLTRESDFNIPLLETLYWISILPRIKPSSWMNLKDIHNLAPCYLSTSQPHTAPTTMASCCFRNSLASPACSQFRTLKLATLWAWDTSPQDVHMAGVLTSVRFSSNVIF